MSEQMFTWRIGALPFDLYMREKGVYYWDVVHARYTARMHEKGNWSLMLGDTLVQFGVRSLRDCIARSFDVPKDAVKRVM
jgi:hypothetical protein